jgi:hypothetical protein
MSPVPMAHGGYLTRVRFPIDARVYGDFLLSCQAGAVIALQLAAGQRLTTGQIRERCGFETRKPALHLMAELQAIWPVLQRRTVPRPDGPGYETEWFIESEE